MLDSLDVKMALRRLKLVAIAGETVKSADGGGFLLSLWFSSC